MISFFFVQQKSSYSYVYNCLIQIRLRGYGMLVKRGDVRIVGSDGRESATDQREAGSGKECLHIVPTWIFLSLTL